MIKVIQLNYNTLIETSKCVDLNRDYNDNKIYSFQEETGSMLDFISLPPLTKKVSIISYVQSMILDIGTESRYDLWYLTNFE